MFNPKGHKDTILMVLHSGAADAWGTTLPVRMFTVRSLASARPIPRTIALRIGINSGEVVVGKIGDDLRMDYTAQGPTVGLAQRMEALAAPDSVYLSDATAALVDGYFALDDLGEFPIRGVAEPVRVHQLTGVGALRTRFVEFRGRLLSRRTEDAARGARG